MITWKWMPPERASLWAFLVRQHYAAASREFRNVFPKIKIVP